VDEERFLDVVSDDLYDDMLYDSSTSEGQSSLALVTQLPVLMLLSSHSCLRCYCSAHTVARVATLLTLLSVLLLLCSHTVACAADHLITPLPAAPPITQLPVVLLL
jgi:hypothetical protein